MFILKIRFPPGKSLATILNKRYKNEALEAFRKFQRLELKLGKAKLDLEFLITCKRRSIISRFLWFKVANRRLQSSSAYRQCQHKLLQEEIKTSLINPSLFYYCDGFFKSLMLGYYVHVENSLSAWQISGHDFCLILHYYTLHLEWTLQTMESCKM